MIASPALPSPVPAAGLEVRPFRSLTYRRRDPEYLARVSSPAYDLVTQEGRARLARSDPHNVVRLILPQARPRAGDDRDPVLRSAAQAAATLRRWERRGVLERSPVPGLWLYDMRPPGDTPATVGWLGAVSLPPDGSAAVLPHEDTFPRAVEGRRALLAATGTDLEPIVLAHDPNPVVAELSDPARHGTPMLELVDADGVRHRLWSVTDPLVTGRLTTALRQTGAVIADGHHRFAAARANRATDPGGCGIDAVLALLTPMGAGGLRVSAIHRVVPGLALDVAAAEAAAGFAITVVRVDGSTSLAVAVGQRLTNPPSAETSFLLTDGHRLLELTTPSANVLGTVPHAAPEAWRRLDVVLAHHGLLRQLWHRDDDPDSVLVAHTVDEALSLAAQHAGVALLLHAPSPADVAAVARAGARMPRKSTLFLPKPRTGLVLRPLAG